MILKEIMVKIKISILIFKIKNLIKRKISFIRKDLKKIGILNSEVILKEN
jgi:hypothetical protein